jgi:hypothetical protein
VGSNTLRFLALVFLQIVSCLATRSSRKQRPQFEQGTVPGGGGSVRSILGTVAVAVIFLMARIGEFVDVDDDGFGVEVFFWTATAFGVLFAKRGVEGPAPLVVLTML